MLLLQSNTLNTLVPSAAPDTAIAVAQTIHKTQELSVLDLLQKGGWVMIPLLFLAFIGLVIFIERYLTIRKASQKDTHLMSEVKQNIIGGKLDAAITRCQKSNIPLGRMLQKGLIRIGRPIKDIEGAIENVGKIEVAKLEKNISILGIIAGIAPMLGFVGTISGVIKIFYNISMNDNISMGIIAGGLYEKMITSAMGLSVGMVAYIGYHILNMMVDKVILKLETDAIEFIDLLEEPGQ